MRAVKLKVEPFKFISLLKWESTKELNEHGLLRISGLISEENQWEYHNVAIEETWVCAKAELEDGTEMILFHGILTSLSIETQRLVHTLTIEVKTGSTLLDRIPHIKSFQSNFFTYKSVIETCLQGEDGKFVMRKKKEEQINSFLVQYKETNWEFCRRLANRLGMVLLPEYHVKGKVFYMGILDEDTHKEILSNSYTLIKTSQNNKIEHLIWSEQGIYRVCSREIYELGEYVLFKGRKLLVGKVESRLEGGELCHDYLLFLLKPALKTKTYNDKIRGISLKAKVTKVEKDKIQLVIHDDENRDFCGNRWFEYATVYSTPDGTGWYCMPELGDKVRLVFPDEDEAKAYTASSVHLDAERGRENPDHKSWKNKQQKEILFTPEKLVLSNNNGLSVEVSDNEGIKISSNKAIVMQSGANIAISSTNAGIQLNAKDNISLNQGAARILMKDEIDISGGKIKMN